MLAVANADIGIGGFHDGPPLGSARRHDMGKRARKKKARKGSSANHGKRPNS